MIFQAFQYRAWCKRIDRVLLVVWLAEVDFGDATKSVNKALLDTGLAVPFMGELV